MDRPVGHPVHVRPAGPADVEMLVTHCLGVASESEGLRPDPAVVRDAVVAAVADPAKARYFVAEGDGRPVGSCFVTSEWSDWRNGWYWWVQGVYVDPAWRRQGVMTALLDAVAEAARAAGDVRRIRLYVARDNRPARAGYAGWGMACTGYRIYERDV